MPGSCDGCDRWRQEWRRRTLRRAAGDDSRESARCSTGDRLDATADPLDERGLHVPTVLRSDSSYPRIGYDEEYRPAPERRDSRMSVAVEHRTVDLWPSNASPVSSRPRRPHKAAVVTHSVDNENPATEALAAITTSYRHGRADIISGDSSPSAGRLSRESPADLPPATYSPTVPLAFLSDHKPAEVPQDLPGGQGREAATFWSRLVRRRRPEPGGRHRGTS
jgi:hypothetical protein